MRSWRARLMVHPATVVAVVLLVVNDQWWKLDHPGLLTGKLSDVAGVWMMTSLLIAATGSRWIGSAVTAIAFTALKSVPSVASWASPILGGTTLTDSTDLVARLVVPGPWFLARGLSNDHHPDRRRALLHVGAVLMATSSVMATTATSCDIENQVDDLRVTSTGEVLASTVDSTQWYAYRPDTPAVEVSDRTAQTARIATTELCAADCCFTVRPGDGLYEGDTPLLVMTETDRKHLREGTNCAQAAPFTSVVARIGDDGLEVWVDLGMAGLAVMTADGTFRTVQVPGLRTVMLEALADAPGPPRLKSNQLGFVARQPIFLLLMIALLIVSVALAIVDTVSRRRQASRVAR